VLTAELRRWLKRQVMLEEKRPMLSRHVRAPGWLRVWTDLGKAPRTIDAYARGLAEYLEMCEQEGAWPAHGEPGTCWVSLCGVDRTADPPWRERRAPRLRISRGDPMGLVR